MSPVVQSFDPELVKNCMRFETTAGRRRLDALAKDSAKNRRYWLNEHGRPVGETHWRATLTDHDVELILALRDDGMPLAEIAVKFEVSKSCVWKIVHGYRRWQRGVRLSNERR
jgi:hypothetical protein